MRTLHVGLRVTDRERSVAFYKYVGYEVIGTVPETGIGHLTMLKLPDDEFVSIELVDDGRPVDHGTDVSHLVVKVESLAATVAALSAAGIEPVEAGMDTADGLRTGFVTDPDGRKIELVQWPEGHADGITAADWQEA